MTNKLICKCEGTFIGDKCPFHTYQDNVLFNQNVFLARLFH